MKRIAVLLVLLAVLLTGCTQMDIRVQTQLVPPGLSGERAEIQAAFENYLRAQDAELVAAHRLQYPVSGDYRSAFILQDLNGDRVQEALVFYNRRADSNEIHMNILRDDTTDGWCSVADFACSSAAVQEVRFADLFGDGTSQILVGWSVGSTRESQLQIFRWREDTVSLCYSGLYSYLVPEPLCSTDRDDLLLVHLQTDSTATATLLTAQGNGLTAVASTPLDGAVVRYTASQISYADDQVGIFLDGEKVSGTLTELLLWDGKSLTAPLFDPLKGGTVLSWRQETLASGDINNDGVVDWPADADDGKPMIHRWQTWDFVKAEAVTLCHALIRSDDGYTWALPSGWESRLTARYNESEHCLTVVLDGTVIFSVTRLDKGTNRNRGIFTEFEKYDYLIFVEDESPLERDAIIARLIEL